LSLLVSLRTSELVRGLLSEVGVAEFGENPLGISGVSALLGGRDTSTQFVFVNREVSTAEMLLRI
jgi:hypothetical protein